MINKDSDVTKEFVKKIFNATHKRWYVEHALGMVQNDDDMRKIISYLDTKQEVTWQDIEYKILTL